MNTECHPTKACINNKCIDPCIGTCGVQAICDVSNHIPSCSCPQNYIGDPFVACRPAPVLDTPREPCNPSPCGSNGLCRIANGAAVCACQTGMIGTPPQCRPECVVSAECALQYACLNQKCRDPCPGTCGSNSSKIVRQKYFVPKFVQTNHIKKYDFFFVTFFLFFFYKSYRLSSYQSQSNM